jgi:hypothetical protein
MPPLAARLCSYTEILSPSERSPAKPVRLRISTVTACSASPFSSKRSRRKVHTSLVTCELTDSLRHCIFRASPTICGRALRGRFPSFTKTTPRPSIITINTTMPKMGLQLRPEGWMPRCPLTPQPAILQPLLWAICHRSTSVVSEQFFSVCSVLPWGELF